MFCRIHAADPGAIRHVSFRVLETRTLDENDFFRNLAVRGPADFARGGPEAELSLSKARPSMHIRDLTESVFREPLLRDQIKTHGGDDGSHPFFHVGYPSARSQWPHRADFFHRPCISFPEVAAGQRVNDGLLGTAWGERVKMAFPRPMLRSNSDGFFDGHFCWQRPQPVHLSQLT